MPESALLPRIGSADLTLATGKIVADTVRHIVNFPHRVDVKIQANGPFVTLMLQVAPDDIGKVIGKQGRTVRSLRMILSSISSKTGVHFALEVQPERT
jgi:predicted RNA-binding protein YlqC (UPF0109 family)